MLNQNNLRYFLTQIPEIIMKFDSSIFEVVLPFELGLTEEIEIFSAGIALMHTSVRRLIRLY
jgi:hypothetical protein